MSRYSVIVSWTNTQAYEVEAEDDDAASDAALEIAYEEHPFADDYEIVFAPELVT